MSCLSRITCLLFIPCLMIPGLTGCNIASTGHNVQGRRLYEQGQYREAIEKFQTSRKYNPRNADAYYNLASTYFMLGRMQRNPAWTQAADQFYRSALNLNPKHTDSYRGLATLLTENGRAQDALQLIQGWRSSQPESAEPLVEMARLYRESGNRSQATQLLADALNVDSGNAVALRAMGKMREESGQYSAALENYIRSYQANNMQTDLAQRIAQLQGVVRNAQAVPFQPGQNRLGSLNQYVPR